MPQGNPSESGLGIVTDGVHVVNPATELDFTSGATVTDLGGGIAGIAVTPGAVVYGAVIGGGRIFHDGTILNSAGLASATKTSTGTYEVQTVKQIHLAGQACVVSALNAAPVGAGYLLAHYSGNIDNFTVKISVTTAAGVLTDGTFSILIFGVPDVTTPATEVIGLS